MNLIADLERILRKQLSIMSIPFDAAATVDDLLILAMNREMKTVSPARRRVHTSKELDTKRSKLDPTKELALTEILDKFATGGDVNGHLSRASANAHVVDELLGDWDIYHLHISNQKISPSDEFYVRTGPVVFVRITDADAYFIDIYEHGRGFPETWTRQELLGILDRNWPQLLEPHKAKGVGGVSHKITDLDLKTLRAGHINAMLQIGDSVIVPPGGGLSMDGTPIRISMRINRTIHLMRALEKKVLGNRTAIAAKCGIPDSELEFELVPLPEGWGVVEKSTRTLVARSDP